ncbi:unnamed protein product [Closterium sp. NIES-65]|nr:unnamed protein product [Closterium sp. NIES-65]
MCLMYALPCRVYTVVGSIEAAYGIMANLAPVQLLSVEQLKAAMKADCSGSTPSQAFQLLLKLAQKGRGLMLESQGSAEKGKKDVVKSSHPSLPISKQLPTPFPIKGFEMTSFYGWFGLLLAVQRQPVVVLIEASADSFKDYNGVYKYQGPACFTYNLNHVVLLVGYRLVGKDSRFPHMAPPFWIIRNSWGPDWAQRNPCAVGTCVNDGPGSYSCVCPPGFRQGTTVEGTFSCAPSTFSCAPGTFSYAPAKLASPMLEPSVSCAAPIPLATVLNVANPASFIPCTVYYSTQQGDTCADLATYFTVAWSCMWDPPSCLPAFQALNPSLDCDANGGLLQPGKTVCVERKKDNVGLILVCSQYYLVQSAETCESICNMPYPPLTPKEGPQCRGA